VLTNKPPARSAATPRTPRQAKNGAVFVSDTDTEVVPHLCEYLWKKRGGKVSLGQLVRSTAQDCPQRRC
jgi:hypothetical protein